MSAPRPLHRGQRPPGPWVALILLCVTAPVIPASLVLSGPLQSNGWPPRLLAFWVAGAVALGWIAHRPAAGTTPSPAETGSWILMGALGVSLAGAGLRALTEEESAGVLRAALVLVPLVVVALGIARMADRRRVDVLLLGVVIGVGVSALVAIAQQVQPFTLAEVIRLPGMVAREEGGFGTRGDYTRVRGAAAHAIELGVMGGALLPLSLHYARLARRHAQRVVAGWATGVIAVAVLLTVSRSAVLAVVVSMAIYATVLSRRQNANLAVLALLGAVLARAAAPGLLGSIKSIFVNAGEDDSIAGRTEDYATVAELFEEAPLIGHGLGTFRPEIYFFLDNQYLMAVIEGGLVLVVATIAFFLLALGAARGARRRALTPADASLAQAVTAALTAIAVSGLFFDLFSFAQITVVSFVLVGVAAALWQSAKATGRALPSPAERVRAGMGRTDARDRVGTGRLVSSGAATPGS